MRYARAKWGVAIFLAVGVFSGIVALIHDAPNSYDLGLRAGRWMAYARATPRHVVFGQANFTGPVSDEPIPPIWHWRQLAVYSTPRDRQTETMELNHDVKSNAGSWRLGDFGVVTGRSRSIVDRHQLVVPTWLACVAGMTPLTLMLLARRRWRSRVSHGGCANCGYDLRASPDRCPECGAVPPSRRAGSAEASASSLV